MAKGAVRDLRWDRALAGAAWVCEAGSSFLVLMHGNPAAIVATRFLVRVITEIREQLRGRRADR